MMHFSQGQVLGRYELLLPVARGGMAEVWAARLHGSRGFRKLVAIKTILRGAIDDTRMEQMFLAEAELASRIQHPNVVQTLELGEHAAGLYLVLEWVDGQSLSALLTEATAHGGMPLRIAVNLVGQACKGLHAAHELRDENGALLGVVHRDISPQNVLVSFSGTVKVVDFGIAKATAAASTLTEAGEVKGKLAYMAPEQLRGSDGIDRRADIFSMGTLLYAMTTGRHPFRGDHPSATLRNITDRGSVPPPSAHVEDYPIALEEVVLKSLKKDPAERLASAHEMLQALERAVPEALERSFDLKVAEFVAKVAGSSGSERHQRIREAGDMLDRLRIKSGTSLEQTSPSSLSALAIDGSNVTQQSPSLLAHAQGQALPQAPVAQSRSKVWWIAAGAVISGGVLGLTLAGGPGATPATSHPASAGGTVAAGEYVTVDPRPAPPTPSAARVSAEAASPGLAEAAPPVASEQAEPAQQQKRAPRAARVVPVAKASTKVAAAPSQPSEA
ncbi:MAG TPA: protein kinase, partial [Polyangiaceae bacterium]|nr:protein kinase [Polyangiaceae bacterium]